jgi:hypothetical protein
LHPEQAAPLCGIQLVDYGPQRGHSLLLGSGCGLMMAVMDAQPEFRWCADLDRGGHAVDFAILIARSVRMLGLVGWFSISEPRDFRRLSVESLACPVVAYGGNVNLGCETLQAFLDVCEQLRISTEEPKLAAHRARLDWTRVLEHPRELARGRLAESVLGVRLGARSHVD